MLSVYQFEFKSDHFRHGSYACYVVIMPSALGTCFDICWKTKQKEGERGNEYDSSEDRLMNHVHVHIVDPKAIVLILIFVHGRCFAAVVQMWNLY